MRHTRRDARRASRPARVTAVIAAAVGLLAGCGGQDPTATRAPATTPATTPATATPPPTPSVPATHSPVAPVTTDPPERPDPRWRFFSTDRTQYTSAWFAGRHRIMIGYGCTTAPWYSPDPRCTGRQGFHHGVDLAIPCGTRLFSAVPGVVVDPSSPGRPGPAYGRSAFRIRTDGHDILIGHTVPPTVRPGERVERGQPIALVSDSAAPDGCHLHFEVRRAGGGVDAAVDPSRWLRLRDDADRR